MKVRTGVYTVRVSPFRERWYQTERQMLSINPCTPHHRKGKRRKTETYKLSTKTALLIL